MAILTYLLASKNNLSPHPLASNAAQSKAVVLLLLMVNCCSQSLFGVRIWYLFCNAVFGVLSSFTIIWLRKIELEVLLLLCLSGLGFSSSCRGFVCVL